MHRLITGESGTGKELCSRQNMRFCPTKHKICCIIVAIAKPLNGVFAMKRCIHGQTKETGPFEIAEEEHFS
jgi:DNA-binding NtrC family response regulator